MLEYISEKKEWGKKVTVFSLVLSMFFSQLLTLPMAVQTIYAAPSSPSSSDPNCPDPCAGAAAIMEKARQARRDAMAKVYNSQKDLGRKAMKEHNKSFADCFKDLINAYNRIATWITGISGMGFGAVFVDYISEWIANTLQTIIDGICAKVEDLSGEALDLIYDTVEFEVPVLGTVGLRQAEQLGWDPKAITNSLMGNVKRGGTSLINSSINNAGGGLIKP